MESRKDRVIRIIKTLMFHLGYDSVQKFADDMGANYMQVYYCYTGKTTNISPNLENKIIAKFPNVSREFLRNGVGDVEGNSDFGESFAQEQNEVTAADMFRLLDRVTTLMEKLQTREDFLMRRLEELKRKEEEIDNKLKQLSTRQIQNCG